MHRNIRLTLALFAASVVGCNLDPVPFGDVLILPDLGPVDAAPIPDALFFGCGDKLITTGERCDDGNTVDGDGCSADCLEIEEGWACPNPGEACVKVFVCGNGRIEGDEVCDDRNDDGGDGCSGCQIERGWTCPVAALPCVAAQCGDGLVVGTEECDDANSSAPGCDEDCRIEAGYKCEQEGADCVPTVCGDGKREGLEQCDDNNNEPFDGCSATCLNEPSCSGGVCTAICGDGVILPGSTETCDDGNTRDGDGCSANCEREQGYECSLVAIELPEMLDLPVIFRDQRSSHLPDPSHPDFNPRGNCRGICFGLVETALDGDGKPVATDIGTTRLAGGLGDGAEFYDWYRASARNETVLGSLQLTSPNNDDTYTFSSYGFYPLDDLGFETPGHPIGEVDSHNYHFTTETHYWFKYKGTESLAFTGDDDLWVFVDGQLCLDVGGLHNPMTGVMDFTDPDQDSAQASTVRACRDRLVVGKVYEVVIFHAERQRTGSNFALTLAGFAGDTSRCESVCGDGYQTRDEVCDDGVNDGSYGSCSPDCDAYGPHCGDGVVQEDQGESCDNSVNLGQYNGCLPTCQPGPRCGDEIVQSEFGETCDDGNTEPDDGCSPTCVVEIG